jgi:magnesium-transporting ATPase (P-type)
MPTVFDERDRRVRVLGVILQYQAKKFIRAASQCQSVLFCRVSATQKRELVAVGKSVLSHRILAIGDGANDVGMIRESHCGIAVYGREGSQAVAASDFAVDRFACLRRLLLVHGAWCFTRTSELILYTFMHNCAYVFVVLYHQIFNGFSGAASMHSLCKLYQRNIHVDCLLRPNSQPSSIQLLLTPYQLFFQIFYCTQVYSPFSLR